MRKTFQKWLFVCAAAAFIVTFAQFYALLSHYTFQNSEKFVFSRLENAKRQIELAQQALTRMKQVKESEFEKELREFSFAVSLKPAPFLSDKQFLRQWASRLDFVVLDIFDKNNNKTASIENEAGFFDEKPSFDFLSGKADAFYLEAPRKISGKDEHRQIQFAGVACPNRSGYIRAARYLDNGIISGTDEFWEKSFQNIDTGRSGMFFLVSPDGKISGRNQAATDIVFPPYKTFAKAKSGEIYSPKGKLFYTSIPLTEGKILVGVYTIKDMYTQRHTFFLGSLFAFVVLYFVMIAVVSFLLDRIIVSGVNRINGGLLKITAGDLDEKIKVHTNPEFRSLSDGINTMVSSLKRMLAERAVQVEKELLLASRIQQNALPSVAAAFPDRTDFEIYAAMTPAKEVGGDFYDFFLIGSDENRLGIVIADVSDKGVPAALFMMSAKTLLRNLAENGCEPAEIFTKANKQLWQNNNTFMFVTVFMGILNLETGRFVYASAGHNPPLVKRGSGAYEYLTDVSGRILGGTEDAAYSQKELFLKNGDSLFLYTDGVTEAQNGEGLLYGEERLRSVLNENAKEHPENLIRRVEADVQEYAKGREQSDDITMLALRYNVCSFVVSADSKGQEVIASEVSERLKKNACPQDDFADILIAIDEITANIIKYAYSGDKNAKIEFAFSAGGSSDGLTMTFKDSGEKFNPLDVEDPDISLPPEKRAIGKMGIFMVKQMMTRVRYCRKDGKNVLTLYKKFNAKTES